MSEPDLVLCLGVPSVCSLDVPGALAVLRPQLHRRGVGYLGNAQLAAGPAPDGFAAERRAVAGGPVLFCSTAALGGSNLGPGDSPQFRPQAASAVAELIEAFRARRVLILMHSRRQDRLMEQAYLREVLDGRWPAFDEQFPSSRAPVLDFGDLLERVSAVRGVVGTVLRPIELAGAGRAAFVDDLLDAVGAKGALDMGPLGHHAVPPVYAPQGLKVALALNPHLETPAERALIRAFLVGRFPASASVNNFLDDAARAGILGAYAEANSRMFAKHMPALPADAYSSDEATARLDTVLTPIPDPDPAPAARGRTFPFAGGTITIERTREIRPGR